MDLFGEHLELSRALLLLGAIALALGFEMVNGFHDTANAVATVIYTHTLRPWVAVIWSGIWNLLGVLHSSGAVAFGIVALLPAELVVNINSGPGFAMIFALLISAIIWNSGTWYLGLPASSSHSLIGSIVGVALANSAISSGKLGEGVNWHQVKDVALSLLISPLLGFVLSGILLLAMKAVFKNPDLYIAADQKKRPPLGIRGLLMLTCTGVSFAHGSNDGQKGMGLLMLILVGVVPGAFALNLHPHVVDVAKLRQSAYSAEQIIKAKAQPFAGDMTQASAEVTTFLKGADGDLAKAAGALAKIDHELGDRLAQVNTFSEVRNDERKNLRTLLYLSDSGTDQLIKRGYVSDSAAQPHLADFRKQIDQATKYIAGWVKVAVAIALGLGTMIGWKRIVVTVGEKIGKSHLSYAQGASAELVAASTISLADYFGLPVSTTHVLSSGIAGTMAANHSGLQKATLRNIVLAWVLTLPVCMLLGAGLFSATLYFVLHGLGAH